MKVSKGQSQPEIVADIRLLKFFTWFWDYDHLDTGFWASDSTGGLWQEDSVCIDLHWSHPQPSLRMLPEDAYFRILTQYEGEARQVSLRKGPQDVGRGRRLVLCYLGGSVLCYVFQIYIYIYIYVFFWGGSLGSLEAGCPSKSHELLKPCLKGKDQKEHLH